MLNKPAEMCRTRIYAILFMCLIIMITQSGCATLGAGVGGLFGLIGTIIGGTLQLIGKTLDIVSKLPMPPPGVF